jgi:hypothetical protein
MKRPTCFELVLILGLSLSAGTKVIAKPILLSVLLLYFSFSFLRFFLFYPLVFGFLSGFSFRSLPFVAFSSVAFSGFYKARGRPLFL